MVSDESLGWERLCQAAIRDCERLAEEFELAKSGDPRASIDLKAAVRGLLSATDTAEEMKVRPSDKAVRAAREAFRLHKALNLAGSAVGVPLPGPLTLVRGII